MKKNIIQGYNNKKLIIDLILISGPWFTHAYQFHNC